MHTTSIKLPIFLHTATTFHGVVRVIETALEFKQYTMVSLDIEGAFNNGTIIVIQQALSDQDVEKYINDWLVTMLKTRIFTADIGNSSPLN